MDDHMRWGMKVRHLTVFCLVSFISNTNQIFFPTSGTISPDGGRVCTGQSLNLTFSPFIPLEAEKVQLQMDEKLYSSVPTLVIDDTAIFTIIVADDAKFKSEKDYVKTCCFTQWDCTSLLIYKRPEPVMNFRCIAYDVTGTTVCSWDLGKEYNWDVIPHLTWRISGYTGPWQDCPDMQLTSCTWRGTRLSIINIRIDVPCECGINATSNFTVDTSTIVMPEPPVKLEATVLDSRCLEITWSVIRTIYLKTHKVIVSSKWNDTQFWSRTDTEEDMSDLIKHTVICKNHPNTIYTISVAVSPEVAGYFSHSLTTTVKTDGDIPSASPTVMPGSFEWYPSTCLRSKYRYVTIYWQPISESDMNGHLRAYVLTIEGDGNGRDISEVAGDVTFRRLYLLCETFYTIHIQARNVLGTSVHRTRVIIPQASSAPPQSEFIVEQLSNGGVRNVAITLKQKGQGHHRIFYCRRGLQGNCIKSESIKWVDVKSQETVLQITDPVNRQFGVSTSKDNSNSGFSWNYCLHSRHAVTSFAPEALTVVPGTDDTSLLITWGKMACIPGEPYIDGYNVMYCVLDDEGICDDYQNITVTGDYVSLLLLRLRAGASYKVRVRGVSNTGIPGPFSRPVYGIPENHSLSPSIVVVIVAVSAICLPIVIVGIVFTSRKVYKKVRGIPPDIEDVMPQVIEQYATAGR